MKPLKNPGNKQYVRSKAYSSTLQCMVRFKAQGTVPLNYLFHCSAGPMDRCWTIWTLFKKVQQYLCVKVIARLSVVWLTVDTTSSHHRRRPDRSSSQVSATLHNTVSTITQQKERDEFCVSLGKLNQPHGNENPIYVIQEKELRGRSPNPISTSMCLWAIYIFTG